MRCLGPELCSVRWSGTSTERMHVRSRRPHVAVWRSVRKHGDTETRKSRRTIALPKQVVDVLEEHLRWQNQERASKGKEWSLTGRVFTTRSGEPLDAANVRRDFKAIVKKAGLEPEWAPRELRHSFASLLSDHGIPLERIALLVGHSSQATTEAVYRKQLRPVITEGAEAMDEIFADDDEEADALGLDSIPLAPCLAPQA
ncbi:tyrosine-type recombinase/integrase [Streptomyces sp. NPDC002668]|uniref:tyrosine-type recombinase/integrase n=1 Tax=Streptomyces sp. NPDC002668 TaxID=3154422 RepID=UPI0033216164